LKLPNVVRKKQEWGMTLTPPWAGEEVARRRAHELLDQKNEREPTDLVHALITRRSPRSWITRRWTKSWSS
jgi:hypothetical protein